MESWKLPVVNESDLMGAVEDLQCLCCCHFKTKQRKRTTTQGWALMLEGHQVLEVAAETCPEVL